MNNNSKNSVTVALLIGVGVVAGLMVGVFATAWRQADGGSGGGFHHVFDNGGGDQISYTMSLIEGLYVDPVNIDSLADLKLMGLNFEAYRNYSESDLQAVFELKPIEETKYAVCDLNLDGIQVNRISVTPIGITLSGSADDTYQVEMDVQVIMEDGSVEEVDTSLLKRVDNGNVKESSYQQIDMNPGVITSAVGGGKDFSIKYNYYIPFDVEHAQSVVVNGNVVELK